MQLMPAKLHGRTCSFFMWSVKTLVKLMVLSLLSFLASSTWYHELVCSAPGHIIVIGFVVNWRKRCCKLKKKKYYLSEGTSSSGPQI